MAAGEVIDSLAAVVRELIDNALDAGSRRVVVDVWPEDWQVRVTDTGSGIPVNLLSQVALPHTTSKLDHLDFPFQVSTLGFRGEALHSLAQVGRLTIYSHAPEDPHGWQAVYDVNGSLQLLTPHALAKGTIVVVKDLFYRLPSRRLALSHHRHSLQQITTLIQESALAHPEVTWILEVNGKPMLTLWPGKTPVEILCQILPQVTEHDLRYDYYQTSSYSLSLILGLPDRCHRPRPDWIRVAINRRFVSLPELQTMLQSAFHHTLPRLRYPLCLVLLDVPPQDVDWNRHPAKTELYLPHLTRYQNDIQIRIQEMLKGSLPLASRRSQQLIRLSEAKQAYHVSKQTQDQAQVIDPSQTEEDPDPNLDPNSDSLRFPLHPLKVLAQLQNTYILAEHADGLWLVEQHVAHERIRYERIKHKWQLIDLPQPCLLSDLTPRQQEHLTLLGLTPELFGPNLWLIRRIPQSLWSPEASLADLTAALQELSQCYDLESAQVAIACRTAIRNGTPLTLTEMEQLLSAWQTTSQPQTCPHGRPTYLTFQEKDLARFFRRRWTICDNSRKEPRGSLGDLFSQDIRKSQQ
jgi:DNA mismatch repair protein MutL